VVKESSVPVERALEILDTLGVVAMVAPVRRAGEQFLKSVLRGIGTGITAPPPAGADEALLGPGGDARDPGATAPALRPAEAPVRSGVLWLAAALAGGLLPVWRDAVTRVRRANRRQDAPPEADDAL